MIRTPYETTVCRAYKLEDIIKEIRRATTDGSVLNSLFTPDKKRYVTGILGIGPACTNVPAFGHPLSFTLENSKEYQIPDFMVVDLRGLIKPTRSADEPYIISSQLDYEFALVRSTLTAHWCIEEPADIANLGEMGFMVFVYWMSQSIVRRLGLSPTEQVSVTIVTAFYWFSLFMENREPGSAFDDRDIRRITTKLNNITQIPATMTLDIAAHVGYMANLNDYVNMLKKVVESPRMGSLNVGLLISMMGGSWWGSNTPELLGVAMEHPPTFQSLIYMACKERGYRKTRIGELVYNYDKRDRSKEFLRNVQNLMERHMS